MWKVKGQAGVMLLETALAVTRKLPTTSSRVTDASPSSLQHSESRQSPQGLADKPLTGGYASLPILQVEKLSQGVLVTCLRSQCS